MTNNITPNTDFSNITITNDYPCLVGGTWIASRDPTTGQTIYTQGSTSYEGPVNLIGATLTIQSGAVVTGLTAVQSSSITVQNGGTLENSDIFNASRIKIESGGLSENNNYVGSSPLYINSGSTSSGDTFYYPGSTSNTSGTLNLSQYTGTNINFKTSQNASVITNLNDSGGTSSTSAQFINPSFPDISTNNPTAPTTGIQNIFIASGGSFGNSSLATTTNYDSNFRLTNDYPTYIAINQRWTASLDANGNTVYSNGTITVPGPINLINATSLTIAAGVVVDGITITSNQGLSTIVYNSGTIQNSFMIGGTMRNQSDGLSQNNTYIKTAYYANDYSNSVTSNDLFVSSTLTNARYNLSNMPAGASTNIVAPSTAVTQVYLTPGTVWDDSYIQTNSAYGQIVRSYGSNIGPNTVVCFLAGTMINTINGYVTIEDIQVGDQVIVYNDSTIQNRAVIWKGHNTVRVNPNLNEGEAGYPIRVLKNAIAEGVPYKDLLITPEHSLFFDNQFIPAYMLVNGSSIFYDHTITEYTYYHIETETHSVINADGMLTESYLDTGNRHNYYQDDNIVNIHRKKLSWNIDSAAPLTISREIVEPIFNKILQRAYELNIPNTSTTRITTNDSGLYLMTDSGEILNNTHENNGKFIFRIPANTQHVRLISRTSKPSDMTGAFVGDRRNLGVLVGNITLLEGHNIHQIRSHLTCHHTKGWDKEKPSVYRWTNGNALLELPVSNNHSTNILVIHVVSNGQYIISNMNESNTLLAKAG